MASDLEEQKKALLPILQRATEIEAMEPRVAYYCRLFALKRALELPHPAEPIRGLIKALFDQCEKDKPKVQPNEASDKEYCKNFALTVFSRADKLDRAKRADINTAKCFYAAAIFLQVLEQFLDKGKELEYEEPEAAEKARYALWRAAELRKALREGRPPLPPPEPADMGAAMAGAAAGSSGGGAEGDMFAGPSYEAGGGYDEAPQQQQQQQQQPPGAPPVSAADVSGGGAAMSSTEEFLSLPRPPSTIPPAGSVGLVEAAAAAGPRFRPGSAVWVVPGSGGEPLKGTVGQMVSPNGAVGGQALYKVALPDSIQEYPDSSLSPAVGAGAEVVFISAVGEHPQHASIIAVSAAEWPVRYLLQLDGGGNLSAAGGQLRLDAGTTPQPQDPALVAASGGGAAGELGSLWGTVGSRGSEPGLGPYPALHGIGAGTSLPGAPPLVDAGPPAGSYRQQPHHTAPQAPPPAPPQAPNPYSSSGGGGYPTHYGGSSGGGGGYGAGPGAASSPAARQQPAAATRPTLAAASAAGAAAAGWSPGAAAALDAAVQAAAAGACRPSAAAMSEAQKCAKFAVSSLNHDDVSGAVKFLTDALKALVGPSTK